MAVAPSASYSLTIRVRIATRPGMLGRVALAIGQAGGDIGAVDIGETARDRLVPDVTVKARDNVLCFPGFFRGLLDTRARTVNDEMKLAAARALAACVSRSELSEEYIIPSVFNKRVAPAVAEGVARAAFQTGTARWRGERPPGP